MSDPTPPPPPGGSEVPPTAGPGVPPPPSMPPPPPGSMGAAPQNGMGTAALVMGILQFVCLGTIASILAIIFGKIGMNKAKQGLATNGGMAKAGFWLGIAGVILSVLGLILAGILIAAGVIFVNNSIDPANNSKTGLSDGNYAMEPNSSLHINDRCSFGGYPINIDTNSENASSVTVVGEGPTQCGIGTGTPDVVVFTVSGGVARIVEVNY
ncbi:MAG: DUF4190 domain-containing protein [Actinomycetota bacterium]|nr:DUF4190 domain-containing protein [Actinomycetota bacterium]